MSSPRAPSKADRLSLIAKDLAHLDKIQREIIQLYREALKLECDIRFVAGDMRETYLKVLKDKVWRANRLVWTFQMETLSRFGDVATRLEVIPRHLDDDDSVGITAEDCSAHPTEHAELFRLSPLDFGQAFAE